MLKPGDEEVGYACVPQNRPVYLGAGNGSGQEEAGGGGSVSISVSGAQSNETLAHFRQAA